MRPDVIITDLVMHRLNGIELTERIRAELPQTKIILMSSFTVHRGYVSGRECCAAWAAESVSKLHQQQLRDMGVAHVTQIKAPEGPKSGEQLPLV